jgi:hypothetical protein
LTLAPSCRLVASRFPVLRIWQVHQAEHDGDMRVDLESNAQRVLVRRDQVGVALEAIDAGMHAWLAAIAREAALGDAIDAAQRVEPAFDLGSALRLHLGAATIVDFQA